MNYNERYDIGIEYEYSLKQKQTMNPKDTQEYVTLRAAAMMFLEAEKRLEEVEGAWDFFNSNTDAHAAALTHLDAARSVLWDVINDKDLNKQS